MLLDLPRDVICSVARFRLRVHTLRNSNLEFHLFHLFLFLRLLWGWWWCPGWKTCSPSLHTPSDGFFPQEVHVLIFTGRILWCLLFYTRKQQTPFLNSRPCFTLWTGEQSYNLSEDLFLVNLVNLWTSTLAMVWQSDWGILCSGSRTFPWSLWHQIHSKQLTPAV